MQFPLISRRTFLVAAAAVPLAAPARAANPWQARFLTGTYDGKVHLAGLSLALDPGWKTYWRVPGAGGIPPDVQAAGDNLKSFNMQMPLPKRLNINGEEIIGYQNEVTFLFVVEPIDATKPVNLNLKSFMGVCETVCIPVPLEYQMKLVPLIRSSPDQDVLRKAQAQLPKVVTNQITAATLADGPPRLILKLSAPVTDVFVECKPTTYVKRPVINGLDVSMELSGKTPLEDLKGADLRFTMAGETGSLEQTVRVA